MDKDDRCRISPREVEPQDTYDTRQAKQRASIKWLLSKAYNNKVPENLKEPFYRDHEDQEHLKPQIVHNLANAELYCLAFANIYSDPNYHNLNHWGIIQTLSRKGITIPDPSDDPLTETVLIQTTPIKLGAHIAVIEATMALYAKEVVTPDRVVAAIHRFTHGEVTPELPVDAEEGLLLWVNHSRVALTQRIKQELERENSGASVPEFPLVKDFQRLCDAAGLAALISFYCPEELPWTEIKVPYLPTVSDSVHNMCLVHDFAHHSLPHTVCHMMPEDVTYLRGNMKMNLIVLLADLFNVLEIHPVKCVRFPGSDRNKEIGPARNSQGVAHKRSLPQAVAAIPDLRSNLAAHSSFTVSKPASAITSGLRKSLSASQADSYMRASPDSLDRSSLIDDRFSEDSFVVHKGRAVPTLSSVVTEDQRSRGNTSEPGRAAGKPSNWEEQRKQVSYAGRRSRRNSLSDESQLTLENFGGSQENLHFLGRNPDKEPAVHVSGRREFSTPSPSNVPVRSSAQDARSTGVELIFSDNDTSNSAQHTPRRENSHTKTVIPTPPVVPIRSSQQDNRSNAIDRIFADNGYGIEKQNDEKDKKEASLVSLKNLIHSKPVTTDLVDGEQVWSKLSSFSDMKITSSAVGDGPHGNNAHPVYLQQQNSNNFDIADDDGDVLGNNSSVDSMKPFKSSFQSNRTNGSDKKKTTTFAVLPNTTTWQQQSTNYNNSSVQEVPSSVSGETCSNIMQLHNIRLKLEEKRRSIENEKRRMEVMMNKQRQKVGKAAFLQAVTKAGELTPDWWIRAVINPENKYKTSDSDQSGLDKNGDLDSLTKQQRPFQLQDVNEETVRSEPSWYAEEKRTPDTENIDVEQYQQTLALMNSSLKDIDADMQRVTRQQRDLQGMGGDDVRFSQQIKELASQQQKQIATLVSQQQQIQTFANQIQGLVNNYSNQSSHAHQQQQQQQQQAKPISLSQIHQMNTSQPQQQQPQQQQQFFLHDTTHRRTWSQQPTCEQEKNDRNVPQQQQQQSFVLHNGNSSGHNMLFQQPTPSPRASPRPTPPPRQQYPAPLPTPSADDMEPQSICFIGDSPGMSHINITSGSKTYRIPSPTRPSLNRLVNNSSYTNKVLEEQPVETPEKGFYISFDDAAPPKRPKPPLRVKRSPKKERFATQTIDRPFDDRSVKLDDDFNVVYSPPCDTSNNTNSVNKTPTSAARDGRKFVSEQQPSPLANSTPPPPPARLNHTSVPSSPGIGLVIESKPDPNAIDEMERKKERILMLSLQRRQQQEELKARKEMEALHRRELEKAKEEDRVRKKEEEKARRAAILEQYKLKKAIEEAEREGKVIDKSDLMKLTMPKMRNKTASTSRPRPKTIHVETSGLENMMTPSKGKKGSSTNLTDRGHDSGMFTRPLRRDQYRGSQDSLASRGPSSLYKDTPSDDGRGTSPCQGTGTQLGRRGSYKTSRDTSEPPSQARGRTKYSTYQSNFRGRKSNSLMNLCGSSSDQDSMVYRYGDTDSGLGRATPPRRAPSPGITSGRHLTSPSGPGSLPPGLISKRRIFDDGASDISSNASSMMEYTGPRLYRQPATKSNRGIMLNAVEYCVFPGVVNREAKGRVLEEIQRSESKHFLILFRDAGCQFRALYSFCPDTEDVIKLYGTGPKQVNDRMFDKFFKYNSGGKCFSQVHTKHLTVTIDAFTIHNSLWQGKKVNLPSKKDMALVI